MDHVRENAGEVRAPILKLAQKNPHIIEDHQELTAQIVELAEALAD